VLDLNPDCLLVGALQSSAVGPLEGSLVWSWYLKPESKAVEVVDMCLKIVPVSLSLDVGLNPRGQADPAGLHGVYHAD